MCWSLLGVKGLTRSQNSEMTGLSFATQRSCRINAGVIRWGLYGGVIRYIIFFCKGCSLVYKHCECFMLLHVLFFSPHSFLKLLTRMTVLV